MNVSFIEEIFNNTDSTFCMWSTDLHHNGTFEDLDTRQKLGDNDWDRVMIIKPGARIKAHWCGIPWYQEGSRFRVIAKSLKKEKYGLRLHQAGTDKGDGIYFIDFGSNAEIGYIAFPYAGDRQFALTISGDGEDISIDLQNRQTKSSKQEVVKALTEFGKDVYDDVREIIKKAAGQAVMGKLSK